MLRITPATKPADATYLMLEGRLVGPWVAELQAAVMAAGSSPGRVHLDLAGVHYVDAQGLALLHRLEDQGVVLQTPSPFVQELLNTSLDACRTEGLR
ncbi:MAG: STAS domain-containing protein [Chromatiales bacterium]